VIRYFDYNDRERFAELYAEGVPLCEIAEAMNTSLATVYREIARGDTGKYLENGRKRYDPRLAEEKFQTGIKNRGRAMKAEGLRQKGGRDDGDVLSVREL